MKIYALALSAQREPLVEYRVLALLVAGLAGRSEAHIHGMREAMSIFPRGEGWTNHQCSVAPGVVKVEMVADE